jgi:hypothetical protein
LEGPTDQKIECSRVQAEQMWRHFHEHMAARKYLAPGQFPVPSEYLAEHLADAFQRQLRGPSELHGGTLNSCGQPFYGPSDRRQLFLPAGVPGTWPTFAVDTDLLIQAL